MKKVLLTKQIPDNAERLLKESGIYTHTPSPEGLDYQQIVKESQDCDGIISMLADNIDASLMQSNKTLQIISNYATGHNNIDTVAATNNGIIVTNTPDVLTDATAELALALLMACSRRIKEAQLFIEEGKWKRWEAIELLGPSLKNKTLGILGMGRIGESFARKCEAALDMKVIYHNRNKKKSHYQHVSFDELINNSDVLSIHCPLTEQTRNIINAQVFSRMKKNSILINTSRGEVCNTEDLLKAIKNKSIFAAGLDVTSPEPLPSTHELYQCPNVIITPHIGSATHEARNDMASLCARNIIAVLNGNKAITPVN